MAVRDGTVVWLGSDDVGLAQFPDAEVVDLDGGFVAPAFVDSHVHLTATGLMLAGLDLRAATSVRHCLLLIAEYAQTHPDGPIWGHGWDESAWPEATPPSTDDLDGVVGDRPAYRDVCPSAFQRASQPSTHHTINRFGPVNPRGRSAAARPRRASRSARRSGRRRG